MSDNTCKYIDVEMIDGRPQLAIMSAASNAIIELIKMILKEMKDKEFRAGAFIHAGIERAQEEGGDEKHLAVMIDMMQETFDVLIGFGFIDCKAARAHPSVIKQGRNWLDVGQFILDLDNGPHSERKGGFGGE